jgi:hypothetical protein
VSRSMGCLIYHYPNRRGDTKSSFWYEDALWFHHFAGTNVFAEFMLS